MKVTQQEIVEALRGWKSEGLAYTGTEMVAIANRIEAEGIAPPDGEYITKKELKRALNCLSIDNAMSTPDFILAEKIWEACGYHAPEVKP